MAILAGKPLVGRNAAMAIDENDMTGQNNEWKAKRDAAVVDATVFGDRFSYDLAGIQKASIEFKGFYGPGTTGYNAAVNQKFGQDSDVLLAVAPQGWLPNGDLIMQPSVITKYDLDTKLKGAVDVDMTAMARGAVDNGYQMFSPLVFMSTTGGVSGVYTSTPLINPASTSAGCAAQLHVFSVAGTTPSLAVKAQGSPDGTTWTDLTGMGFAAATGSSVALGGAQRIILGNGNVIPAQIRFLATVTGTGGLFAALVGFSRNVVYS